jgi:hypothetical protein
MRGDLVERALEFLAKNRRKEFSPVKRDKLLRFLAVLEEQKIVSERTKSRAFLWPSDSENYPYLLTT